MNLSPKAMARLGWGIRISVPLLYVLWVLIGFCMLRHASADPGSLQYVAVRKLPVGHRLLNEDFRPDPPIPFAERSRLSAGTDLVGKYLLQERAAGQNITPQQTAATSPVHVDKDMVEYLFPLEKQPELVRVLDVASRVDLCAGVCILQNLRVLSVVCSSATPPECFSKIEISPDDAKKIVGEMKNYRLIPR